ncbi:MAG: hypothetical protein RBS91_09760 [Sulfurimonadaceae bacterium]|jgi:hypothetical protein|nr:hypothetical protein [Sulfurimonadaceae bacterium]
MARSGIPSRFGYNLNCILYKANDTQLNNEQFCNKQQPLLYFRAKVVQGIGDTKKDMMNLFLYDKRNLLIETVDIIPDEVKSLYLVKIENFKTIYMVALDDAIQRSPLYNQRQLVNKTTLNYRTFIRLTQ